METVPLALGLTSKVHLTGWYAAPDTGGEGYYSILAEEDGFAETRVRKVRTLKETEGGAGAEFWEELEVECKWFLEWFSRKTAIDTHKKYVASLPELFE